ncbi:galactose-1-phosphate uridylyltransferase [Sulfitobacter undariae]|uniref:Galactose-1-phosphate uridylyltransferase n=1 Tax=Sulfitobacter undariae TaxID=1563671 RepID=A0A7W6E121_9RHOB|nr:hypothetical protein [Sulfitobacter undariae]MBB3992409.1 galactose-1-phosphate uridylyltransferase [Sulfitobacter undariae]
MLKRFSVRNLDEDAIDMLADIKAEERRELGAILEDCISAYWHELFEADASDDFLAEVGSIPK